MASVSGTVPGCSPLLRGCGVMRPTFYGSAAHQVGIGEVEGCVQAEVGLHDTPNLLGHIVVHVGTLQRNLPFLPKLQRTLAVSCPGSTGCQDTEVQGCILRASPVPLRKEQSLRSLHPTVSSPFVFHVPSSGTRPHVWGPSPSHLPYFYCASPNSQDSQGNSPA